MYSTQIVNINYDDAENNITVTFDASPNLVESLVNHPNITVLQAENIELNDISQNINDCIEEGYEPCWMISGPDNKPVAAAKANIRDYRAIWNMAKAGAVQYVMMMEDAGIHPEVVNKLLSPFMKRLVTVVIKDINSINLNDSVLIEFNSFIKEVINNVKKIK